MPANPTAEDEITPHSVQRASTRTVVAVQLVLASLILLSVNYLAGSHHRVWDLSQNSQFTLSNQTRSLLTSSLLQDRDKPITIIAAVRRSSPHYGRLRAMLEQYQRFSKQMVRIEFVDPIRDADRALEIAEQYGQVFVEDLVIVDAMPELPVVANDQRDPEQRAQELEALRQSHIQSVPLEEMLVMGLDHRRERRLQGYQDEDQLSSAIRRALEGKARRFYFLADKSQIESSGQDAPWEFLSSSFASLNIQLVPIRLSGLDKIPDDAAGVALVAPRYDLDEKLEMPILRAYWARPRAALLVVLDPTRPAPPQLRKFLREHGVTPRPHRLYTMRGDRRVYDVAATFTTAAAAGDLGNASTLFEGASSILEVREGAEDLDLWRINPVPLIQAVDGYRVESRDGSPVPPPPYYLGASVSRGNEQSDATAASTSRMVVLANSNFLRPDGRHKEHLDFLRNATNWLIGREELMGIGPKPVQRYLLNLDSGKVSFANRLNLFFIPGAFLLVAAFVWNARRA